jgi:hypothetical protein
MFMSCQMSSVTSTPAVMAAVLRHTRHPLRIVEEGVRLANRLVITEMYTPELGEEPVARLVPAAESGTWDTWWDFSPGLLARFLGVLGFGNVPVTHHTQRYLADVEPRSVPFFTIVAEADRDTSRKPDRQRGRRPAA